MLDKIVVVNNDLIKEMVNWVSLTETKLLLNKNMSFASTFNERFGYDKHMRYYWGFSYGKGGIENFSVFEFDEQTFFRAYTLMMKKKNAKHLFKVQSFKLD